MTMSRVWELVQGDVALRLAGRSGVLGFATVVMLIFGGWPKTFVRRTSAV